MSMKSFKDYDTGISCCPGRLCCCRKIKKNWFYVKWIAFPFLLTAYMVLILCIIYLNYKVKNELIEVHRKLQVVQEKQHDMINLILTKLQEKRQYRLNSMLENSNENKISLSSYGNKDSDQGSENEPISLRKLVSQFVDRLNGTANNLSSDNTVGTNVNIPLLQNLLTTIIDDDLDSELPKKLCQMVLETSDVFENSLLCVEGNRLSNRDKRSNKRGPVASHFKGGVPETYIQDGGLVAPWFHDNRASGALSLKYEFQEGRGTVEVAEGGLYMIYAQVFYLTTEVLNSFTINIREKDNEGKAVAFCSANAVVPPGGVTEVSCYTAVIHYLNATNQVYLTQRDRNRRMILRDGHSFLGIIRLNSIAEPKRRRPDSE